MAYIPQTTGVLETPTMYNLTPQQGSGAYGSVPNLPPYTTDTTKMAGTDIQSQMIANLPGYQGAVEQAMGNITNNLGGVVGSGVAANLGVRAAEQMAGGGLELSPAAATNFLSRYGLTSNALAQQAQPRRRR